MKRQWIFLVAVLSLSLMGPGCVNPVPWTPEAKVLASRELFNSTVHILATLRGQDAFSEAEAEYIGILIATGAVALDTWQDAVLAGDPTEGPMGQFNLIMRQLTAAQKAADERTVSDDGT